MVSAGSTTLAFAHEQDFLGSLSGAPDYWKFGRDPTVNDISIDESLSRLREGDQVEPVTSLRENIEGAFEVEAVVSADVFPEILKWVFNDAGAGFTSGVANTARVFAGVDYIGGTAERELYGVTPTGFDITYSQGDATVTYTLTCIYAKEEENTSISPSSITGPSDGNDAAFHEFDLSIDGGAYTNKLQSASLSWESIARFQRGASAIATDAVIAAPQCSLSTEAVFGGPSNLELAYGSSGSTSIQDSISSVSGTLTLNANGSPLSTFALPKMRPANYSWSALVDAENDLTEPVDWNIDGQTSIS